MAAHRDDIEIVCGGTVIKLVDLGYKVGILDLTEGEMGTRGSAHEREREANCAAKVMGVQVRDNLKLQDARVQLDWETKMKAVEKIRKYQPHLLILPYWEQRHPDHAACSYLGWDASFLAGLKKITEVPGEPHRPFKIIYATVSVHERKLGFIVDITDQFERKTKAVKCYASQFLDRPPEGKEIFPPARDIYLFMEARARHYGYLIGKKYGEPFMIKENIEVVDPMKMNVRSI
jgi:bacillithiol biosynthesis deacetylase BshB1